MADTPALAMQSALAPMAPTAPPLPQESPDMQRERQLADKFEAGIGKQRQDFEAGQAALDPARDRLLKVLESPVEAKAHLEKVKEAPKPEDYQKYSLQFASGMALLGAFAGKFTRAGGTAALDAFGSAVKGWQEGNLQAWHQGMEKWKADTERVLANNRVEIEKYSEIINNKRLTVEQMMAGLNIRAAQFQNKVLFDATESGNFEQAFKLRDMLVKNAQNIQQSLSFFNDAIAHGKEGVQRTADLLNNDPNYYAAMAKQDPEGLGKFRLQAETLGIKVNPAPSQQMMGATRSAPAMYMQSFVQDYRTKHGGADPPPEVIAEAMANYNASQSAGRGLGTRFAQTGFAAEEARGAFDLALQSSDALPRGHFVPLNRWMQAGLAAWSDPQFRRFKDANEAAITAYSATMSRSGANTVHAQERANQVLSTADSPEAYRAGIEQLRREVEIVESAPEHARKAIMDRLFGRHSEEAPPVAGGKAKGDDGWGQVQVH